MEQDPNIPALRMDVIDGVARYPRTGINVVIVGGGIGGLMCALECWRKGHQVHVLERTSHMSSIGDFFTIGPSALATMKFYPSMKAEYEKQFNDCELIFANHDGTVLAKDEPEWQNPAIDSHAAGDVRVSFANTRSFFAKMLLDQATRLGITVEYNRRIVRYSEDKTAGDASVETDQGTKYTGDVIIAADGIGTKSNAMVRGGEVKAIPTGFAVLRVCFSRNDIQPESLAVKLFPRAGQRPKFMAYVDQGKHCILCFTKDQIGINLTHPDIGIAAESWSRLVAPSDIFAKLQELGNWDPAILDLVKQIPCDVVDWKLTWRDPQPIWTSEGGRILQLGDACHSFIPTSGNGATQALEDAISIAECLRLGGRKNVDWSTKVHERLRFKRTSTLQRMGFAVRNTMHNFDVDNLKLDPSKVEIRHGRWTFQHNPETYASEKYALAYAHLRTGAPFEDTNLPKGFLYQPWNMAGELEREKKGEPSMLRETGDWD